MKDMHSNYYNMHENEIFYALNYINNHVVISLNCMSSKIKDENNYVYH